MASPSQGPPTALSFPPERAGAARPHLLVLAGPQLGTSVELGTEPLELGRDATCGIVLDSDGVSRKHARVQLIFALYFVTDLGSTNGTFVNDQRIEMTQLKDGDQIRIGDSVLKFVANQIEVQYSKRVLDLATTDALTGTANKQQFDAGLDKALSRFARTGQPASLILLDVDHFKAINDRFGHAAGDQVLAAAARVMSGLLPAEAALYRVGGEEFAIVLPGAGREQAVALAERLRATVAETPVEHERQPITFTVSLGVAEPYPGETGPELYARADALVYGSKRRGRNRVS